MFIKHKVALEEKKPLLVGSDVKSYISSNEIHLDFMTGISFNISYSIGKWTYPSNEIIYYENKIFSSLIKFPYNLYGKFNHTLAANYDGRNYSLNLFIDPKGLIKKFKITFEIRVSAEEKLRIKFDELRDAFVIKGKNLTYLLAPLEEEILFKEIINISDNQYKLVFSSETKNKELNLIISDSYDSFDTYKLKLETKHNQENKEKSNIELTNKNVEKIYKMYRWFLKNHDFKNKYLSTLAHYLLDPLNPKQALPCNRNKKSILSLFYEEFCKSLIGKKVDWISLLEESKRGNSLMHTLLLANALIDKQNYEEAWKLLNHYANTIIDYHLYDINHIEMYDITKESFLFMRLIKKLFLNFKSINKLYIYLPQNNEFVIINDIHYIKNLEIYTKGINEYEIVWEFYHFDKPNFKKFYLFLSNYLIKDKKIILPIKWKKISAKHYKTEGKFLAKIY